MADGQAKGPVPGAAGCDIAVVVPLFNGARWIEQSLRSVLGQVRPPEEVIVVDDGSTDDSIEVVRAIDGIVMERNPGRGAASARNFGAERTNAPLLAFLDQDDVWHPDHLRVAEHVLKAAPECPAFAGGVVHFTAAAPRFGHVDERSAPFDPWDDFPWNRVATPSSIVARRHALASNGGWPTRFPLTGDHYLWLRLGAEGPLAMGLSRTVGHRVHRGAMSFEARRSNAGDYLAEKWAASADALAHRLSRCATGATELRRRLDVLPAIRGVVDGLVSIDDGALAGRVAELEETLSAEDDAFVRSACETLFWFVEPLWTAETPQRTLEALVERWPADDSRTRRMLRSAAKRLIPFNLFLRMARERPTRMGRWAWVAEVALRRLVRRAGRSVGR